MNLIPESLLLSLQIFGVFPVKLLTNQRGNLVLLSSAGIYLWGCIMAVGSGSWSYCVVSINTFKQIQGQPRVFHTIVACLSHLTLATMAVILVFRSAAQSKLTIKLYRMLQKFDFELRIKSVQPNNRFPLYSFVCQSLAILTFSINAFSNNLKAKQMYIPRFFLSYTFWAGAAHFHHLCYHICVRIKIVNRKIQEEMKRSGNKSSALRIKSLMDSYWFLMDALRQFQLSYRSHVVVSMFSIFLNLVFRIYNACIFLISSKESMGVKEVLYLSMQVLWFVTHGSQLILFVWSATRVTTAAKETAPMTCQTINGELNVEALQQVKRFLFQLLHQKASFSAMGLFTVHFKILPQMAGVVMTYLAVLLQSQNSIPLSDFE